MIGLLPICNDEKDIPQIQILPNLILLVMVVFSLTQNDEKEHPQTQLSPSFYGCNLLLTYVALTSRASVVQSKCKGRHRMKEKGNFQCSATGNGFSKLPMQWELCHDLAHFKGPSGQVSTLAWRRGVPRLSMVYVYGFFLASCNRLIFSLAMQGDSSSHPDLNSYFVSFTGLDWFQSFQRHTDAPLHECE
eukprot:Gb_28380 [translate_table: standard]